MEQNMNTEKLITALRKARKYIRTVEAIRSGDFYSEYSLEEILGDFAESGEIKAIEDALAELGIIV